MFNYLYYKLYQAALKSSLKDIPNITASAWLGGLIGTNILVIYIFLVKIDLLPYFFGDPKQGGWLFALIIILVMLYYRSNKRDIILEKYSQENDNARKRGNVITSLYVIFSFILIFAIAFFKPGKL
jgi:hypothetical protein